MDDAAGALVEEERPIDENDDEVDTGCAWGADVRLPPLADKRPLRFEDGVFELPVDDADEEAELTAPDEFINRGEILRSGRGTERPAAGVVMEFSR